MAHTNMNAEPDVISILLGGAVEQLDVPGHLLALADQIYDDIGLYLSDNLSGGGAWSFYPQGSGRIGTGVRPARTEEWDLDTVAELDVGKEDIGKAELKQDVGNVLAGYVNARRDDEKLMPTGLEPGRRCWTLLYEGRFHVDVLPAVPNPDGPGHGIWITDRGMLRWQPSNPKGYAEWFETRMRREFLEQRSALAKAANVSIDDIPTWRVKTVLQQEVQVLKLHRNSFFADDVDNRPPSCVVTTLAGLAYTGETSLTEALMVAASDMQRFIEMDGDIWMVENPAQPDDNLADRWSTNPESLARFQPWLDDLQRVLDVARGTRTGMHDVVETLSLRFDKALLQNALRREAESKTSRRAVDALAVTSAGALTGIKRGTTSIREHTFHGE